jgi:IS6 family transposase
MAGLSFRAAALQRKLTNITAVARPLHVLLFLLGFKRDAAAAERFFRKALRQPHTVNPRTITADKNPTYPKAIAEMK